MRRRCGRKPHLTYSKSGGKSTFCLKKKEVVKTAANGFTLIEMSIVLVVIAFIISGIIGSHVLVRQSQVRSIMTDEQTYVKAAQNFQQKYAALPGDMSNATTYWGSLTSAAPGCPPTPGSASPGGTATCNGNGNGQVENGYEDSYFWQHLANAQMIPGHYTGFSPASPSASTFALFANIAGVNVPAGRIDGSGFGIFYMQNLSGLMAPQSNIGHVMFFGMSAGYGVPENPLLTTMEAQSFDTKYDDGVPETGHIQTWLPSYTNAGCATTSVPSTAVYNTALSGMQCALIFITGF